MSLLFSIFLCAPFLAQGTPGLGNASGQEFGGPSLSSGGGSGHVLPEAALLAPDPEIGPPLSQYLENMNGADRANAQIRFELLGPADDDLVARTEQIEELWNGGASDEALAALQDLEAVGDGSKVAVGISWRTPKPVSPAPDFGTDVSCESRGDVAETTLDYHAASGNLYAVTRMRTGGTAQWAVNRSTDDGATWTETYAWISVTPVSDVSAAVQGNYLYIAYAPEDALAGVPIQARMRRTFSSGTIDSIYFWVEIFDEGVEIKELVLSSNADEVNDFLRHVAILADGTLTWHWSNDAGATFNTYAGGTGVTDAAGSLDATYNEGYLTYHTFVSFRDTSDNLSVWMKPYGTAPTRVNIDSVHPTSPTTTGIAAYQDTILVAFVYNYALGPGVRYRISYDGGATWLWGTLDEPAVAGESFLSPNVAARGGAGISVAYQHEDGLFDPVLYRHRTYPTPSWTSSETLNALDVITGTPLGMESIPGIDGIGIGYGVAWIHGSAARNAYFDRNDGGFGLSVGPSPPVGGAGADFVVTGGAPLTNTWLAYSLVGPGATFVPALGVTLGLASPAAAPGSPALTDVSGDVAWSLVVPAALAGTDVWLQAVQAGQVSNVIGTTVD